MANQNDETISNENLFELRKIEDISKKDRILINKAIEKFNSFLESSLVEWDNNDYLDPIKKIIELLGDIESSFEEELIILFEDIKKLLIIDKKNNKVGSNILVNYHETKNSDFDETYLNNMDKNNNKLRKFKQQFNEIYNTVMPEINKVNKLLEYNNFNTLILKEKIEELDFYVNAGFDSIQDTVVHIRYQNTLNNQR